MLRLVSVCQQGGRKRQRLHEQLTAQTQLQQHVRLQQARQQRQEARAEAQAVAAGRVRREQAEQRDRAYAVEDRAYAVEEARLCERHERQQRQEARAEAQAAAADRVRREQAEQRDRAYAEEEARLCERHEQIRNCFRSAAYVYVWRCGVGDFADISHRNPRPCETCGTPLIGRETSGLCCNHGKLRLSRVHGPRDQSRVRDNPPELERLLDYPYFGRFSRAINSMLSLTSIGCKRHDYPQARFQATPQPGCLRLHGQTYHRALPADRLDGEECGLSYYLYDRTYEDARGQLAVQLSARNRCRLGELVDQFRQYLLAHNEHVRAIRFLGEGGGDGGDVVQLQVIFKHRVHTDELAHYSVSEPGPSGDTGQIIFYNHNSDQPKFVDLNSALYDVLQFPLLYPRGGRTWFPEMYSRGKRVTLADYTRAVHMQDVGDRLCRLGVLGEQVLLDNYSRIKCARAKYWRSPRLQRKCATVRRVLDASGGGHRVGRVFLPMVPGSPAYQSELIKDAMAVVVQKGPPTYFITMTANAKWPEIEALTTPQCALCKAACAQRGGPLRGIRRGCMQCKRPQTVIARVFKQKMHKMLDIVKQWEGGLEYYFLVVEFQNRGLPHCHLALWCKDPRTSNRAR